jgi:hypothetical protein
MDSAVSGAHGEAAALLTSVLNGEQDLLYQRFCVLQLEDTGNSAHFEALLWQYVRCSLAKKRTRGN